MNFSLVSGVFTWTVAIVAMAVLVASLFPLNRHRTALIAAVGVISLGITVVALHFATKAGWIVPALPWQTQPWVWAAVFALIWAGVGWRSGRVRSRILAGVSVPVSILMALVLFNAYFYFLPSFGDVVGRPPADRATAAQVKSTKHFAHVHHWARVMDPVAANLRSAPHGLVLPVAFPGDASHFKARHGWVYLPPAWWGPDRSRLPVVELFGGTPSSPLEWLRGAKVQDAGDAYAAAHGGVAPIMAMVDVNGSFTGDTECVDRPGTLAETYAVVDIRRQMSKRFGVSMDPHRWGVAGLSEGGMCALAVGLRHPDQFSAIGDFGGEPTQTLGNPQATLQNLFAGNRSLQQSYDPNTLMQGRSRPNLWAMFISGNRDSNLLSLKEQAVLAQKNGMHVSMQVIRGGHTYHSWERSMQLFVPFAMQALAPDLTQGTSAVYQRPQRRTNEETHSSIPRDVDLGQDAD